MTDDRPHVVIVGGGFGGLRAARALDGEPVRVTLFDRRNHHLFQPLLYQVATAALNPSDIATPIRSILRRQENCVVLLDEVAAVEADARRIRLADGGTVAYDHLIVATGATHSYFGHDEWAARAPGLKTIEDALEIRTRILYAFEQAEKEEDEERRRAWMTFVVIGGGPTGVELAGALGEIGRYTLARDFRRVDPAQARVLLVEGVERVLPTMPAELSAAARRQLEELGVEVLLGARVTSIDEAGVRVGELVIAARTVLWAAGVAASPLARSLGAPLDRIGRVRVEPDLSVPGHPEVQIVGDLVALEENGRAVPGVAPAALQMGRHAAANVMRALRGQPRLAFHYVDKGELATIGRARAVGRMRRLRLTGFAAWVAWLAIHIFFLIGFRNRLLVLFEWAWSYVTFRRGARLITGPDRRARPPTDGGASGRPDPRAQLRPPTASPP